LSFYMDWVGQVSPLEPEIHIVNAVYALAVGILTYYNFSRSPHEEDKRNRTFVLLAVLLFGSGGGKSDSSICRERSLKISPS